MLAHLPPSRCQGFFSGLTELTKDELNDKGKSINIMKGTTLKVRTALPRTPTRWPLDTARAVPRGCDAGVGMWQHRAVRSRGLRTRALVRAPRWCERTTESSRSHSRLPNRPTTPLPLDDEQARGVVERGSRRWSWWGSQCYFRRGCIPLECGFAPI